MPVLLNNVVQKLADRVLVRDRFRGFAGRSVPRPIDASKDQAILQAATELLFEEGPQGCSMEAVARRAGVSRVTVYARYPHRQALLDVVVQTCVRELSAGLDVPPADALGVRGALVEFGQRLLDFVQGDDYWRLVRAICAMQGLTRDEAAAIFQQGPQFALDRLAGWMEGATRQGLARFDDSPRDAEHLMGMWVGLDIVRAVYGLPPPRDAQATRRHVEAVVDRFLRMHGVGPAA